MNDSVTLLEKIIKKFHKRPESFYFLVERNKEIAGMVSDIYHKYMNLPKFSELVQSDPRRYKSYYCNGCSSSINGFVRILKNHKFYPLELKDDWDIYFPNGYNRIEIDLNDIYPHNEDQVIFGIQGCDNLVGKTKLWKVLEGKYGREIAKTIIPETYVFSNNEQMEMFKEHFQKYDIYIIKSRRQRKTGLKISKSLNEILKSKEQDYTLVQKYLTDPLLVNGRKLNLRIYLLLTTKDGDLRAYISNHGSCIYSNKEYDLSNLDFEHHITSYNLDYGIYGRNPLTIKQLKTYLIDVGYDNPNRIFEKIDEKTSLVVDAIKPYLLQKENLYNNLCVQIFGMDFIVDRNLEPFLLEVNKGPDMQPKSGYSSIDTLIQEFESFQEAEEMVEKSYPIGYKSGNGLKVQKDVLGLLGIIDSDKNGFYRVY